MKFRKGQKALTVPPIGELLEAVLVLDQAEVRLSVVHMEQIVDFRKRYSDGTSWPTMVALARGASEVHMWPTPHKGGTIRLRYFPPAQEV